MHIICLLNVIPCRKAPSHRSEMVTQMLFGETAKVIDEEDGWYHIRTTIDSYECWIDKKQCSLISEETINSFESANFLAVSTDLVHILSCPSSNSIIPIVLGSTLPFISGKKISIEKTDFIYEGTYFTPSSLQPERKNIIETAFMYLGTPYLWGGRTPFGIDCSGFTQIVFKSNGVKIPRDAYQQAEHGVALSFLDEAQPGDLAFFDNEEGFIIHVGIILDNHKIIHASGKVRVDTIDQHGIFNAEMKKYSHNLRIIKKIL